MFNFNARMLASASFVAIVAGATPAFAQASATPDQCATITDEAQKQACLDQADEANPTAQEGEAATLPPEATPAQTEQGAIVVTGSRIRRSEFNSPDPITIINPELGQQQGQTEAVELINSSPIAAGSTQITSAISTNFVTNGGEGAQTVSLRGLGAERTLVLMNGRRAGPAGVRGAVASFDLNVIPISILNSIEILKTGASSIYGSDAIAGVVNLITKRDTKGLEIRGSANPTEQGGAEAYTLSAAWGKEFERGHVMLAADYFKRNSLKRNQRDFLDCAEEYLTFTDGRRADLIDIRTGQPACAGILNNAILTNNDFSGQLVSPASTPFVGAQPLFVTQYQVGTELQDAGCIQLNPLPAIVAPSYAYGCNFNGATTAVLNNYNDAQARTDVFSNLKRHTLYADASYEITDGIELFTELLYNNRKTQTDSVAQISTFLFTGTAPALVNFLCAPSDFNCAPGAQGDPFNTEFAGNFLLRPLIQYDADSGTDIDYYRGVLGARGDFGGPLSNFAWDLHGQYSRSDGEYFQDIAFTDSLFTQDFRTASCVGLVTPVRGVPCIDIDFTNPTTLAGNFTPAEREFLFGRDVGRTVFKQISGEGVVTGNVVELPAGSVGIAVGAHLRRDEIKDVPGEAFLDENAFNRSTSGVTAGHTMTREVFGEVEVPLFHNTPFLERFTISAAGRITRVRAERQDGADDKFGDETWKLGADWKVNDWLRFRGSWGTSFRAPALFELFLENETGFQQVQSIDPCLNIQTRLAGANPPPALLVANCAAAGIPVTFGGSTGGATVIGGGGLGNLEPETSTAKVFGAIFTPRLAFLPDTRFSLAVDYFDIEVRDEISQLGASNIVNGCYFSENFASEPLCNLITRIPSGLEQYNIDVIEDTYINVNNQRQKGIDVTGRIEHNFGNLGRVSFLAQMTWQIKDEIELFEGSVADDNGEFGDPRWVGDFTLTWDKGPWTAVYGLDVIGSVSDEPDFRASEGAALDVAGCRTSVNRTGVPLADGLNGARVRFCPVVSASAYDTHAVSLTRRIGEKFAFTFGVSNLFNNAPPRVSTVFNGGINLRTFGQVPAFASQYDYLGRRFFANFRAKF